MFNKLVQLLKRKIAFYANALIKKNFLTPMFNHFQTSLRKFFLKYSLK